MSSSEHHVDGLGCIVDSDDIEVLDVGGVLGAGSIDGEVLFGKSILEIIFQSDLDSRLEHW